MAKILAWKAGIKMLGNSVHDSFINWTSGMCNGKSSPATEPGPKCSLRWGYALLQPMNFNVTTAAARHSMPGITSWPARVLITIGYKW